MQAVVGQAQAHEHRMDTQYPLEVRGYGHRSAVANERHFFALALGAGFCLMAYAYAKRTEINRQLKLPGEKQKFAWMLAPFGIYLLLLYSMFMMQHSMLAQAKEKRSVKSTLQTLSYRAKNRLLNQRLIKPILSLDKD